MTAPIKTIRPGLCRALGLAVLLASVLPSSAWGQSSVPAAQPDSARAAAIETYRAIAAREAKARDLPPEIADAVMKVESNYNPRARGGAGEFGIMQVMPPTARLLGHKGADEELADPETNIRLGVRYLAEAYRLAHGDLCTTLMKYRAGHRETRFSVLSVNYCVAARRHLASLGHAVKGEVPAPTFGFSRDVTRMGSAIGTQQAARRLASGKKLRSRVNWSGYDARMKALDAKIKRISL
ncbi:MAG: lytic transglycosylase domain-containing protein [Beijerinckiaceae bacterium]